MLLFTIGIAPVLAVLFYVYIRDRYEKEPLRLLVVGVITGLAITYPIIQTEMVIAGFMPVTGIIGEAFFSGVVVAALTETAFKFLALFLLTWYNANLNEPFDGIVYSVFIALGFAWLENILYIFHPELGGLGTALIRASISIPAHALFAVTTGYYFAMARFDPSRRAGYLVNAFTATWLLHGAYDFLLLSQQPVLLVLFVPLMIFMWHNGLRQMERHLEISPFKRKA
ncbi:MAG: PrsW family glutamic-type intramembrane protease [Defluviitaleaceae bacterium]|nr:PrsW family glutamic-type intramembrane protease [Defluviitaleaceae bacterium]MCL2835972.1 PrsW family glutamic-type intramembrane protease [Defluviitaleaceae bacterium]